jgi:hypothetical protein
MPGRIAIHGHGIAAYCCARLLSQAGFEVACVGPTKSAGPTLLISQSTQTLLADVFGTVPSLFSGFPAIRKRIVLWGNETEPKILPHSGIVINETALLERLRPRFASFSKQPDWSIHSTFTASIGREQHFGCRTAKAVPIRFKTIECDACWVESLESGWLFLLPSGARAGSLLSVGGPVRELLDQSRLVAQQIEEVTGQETEFAAHPRILDPLCGPGWLACGGGAMSFDPICGEGAGNAVREAILASAVVRLIAGNEIPADGLAHYSSRLLAGFLRHLQTCAHFYASARQSEWWDLEIAGLERGMEWARRQLSILPKPRYRLVDFSLVAG